MTVEDGAVVEGEPMVEDRDARSHRYRQARAGIVAAVLIPIGIGTKMYGGPGAVWIAGNLGGAVYVMFWTMLALAFRPQWSAGRVAGAVFLCTTGVEFLQLWNPPVLDAARGTLPGQALLGGVFSWVDIPFYAVGAVLGYGVARRTLDPASAPRRATP